MTSYVAPKGVAEYVPPESATFLAVPALSAVPVEARAPLAAFDASKVRLSLSRVASGLSSPLFVTGAGDSSGRLYVLEQAGLIRVLSGGSLVATPFLDIRAKIASGSKTKVKRMRTTSFLAQEARRRA